jgi:hypothetical protein
VGWEYVQGTDEYTNHEAGWVSLIKNESSQVRAMSKIGKTPKSPKHDDWTDC